MGDYGRFIRMILNDGELDGVRVLAPDTVAQMVVNQMGDLRVEPLVSAMPQLTNDAEFFPGAAEVVGDVVPDQRRAGTDRSSRRHSDVGRAGQQLLLDRPRPTAIGGAYLSQILPFADPGSLDLFTEFETAVYAAR